MIVLKSYNTRLYQRIAQLLFVPLGLISPLMGPSQRGWSVARVLHASKLPAGVSNQQCKEGVLVLKEANWRSSVSEFKERHSYDLKSNDAYAGLGGGLARTVPEDHPDNAAAWYQFGRTLGEKGDGRILREYVDTRQALEIW